MGCRGVALAMLMPSGKPVPLFASRLGRFWHGLGFGAFVGDTYVDGQRLHLGRHRTRTVCRRPIVFRAVGHGSHRTVLDQRPEGRLDDSLPV
jgi:hypothetical protein